MVKMRGNSNHISSGWQQYDGSHILRTPVLSELCFLLHKINFAARKQTRPNRDVGGEENSKVGNPECLHIEKNTLNYESEKSKKPGRKKSSDPAIYKYSIRLNAVENDKYLTLVRQSGQNSNTDFIKAMIFSKQMKVVFIDKASKDYYMRLTNIYEQYRHIGVNYNQVVKALKTNFSEKRALAMLYKLEKQTIELVRISKEVLVITQEYEKKWLQK